MISLISEMRLFIRRGETGVAIGARNFASAAKNRLQSQLFYDFAISAQLLDKQMPFCNEG